jgi:hypothetical protein
MDVFEYAKLRNLYSKVYSAPEEVEAEVEEVEEETIEEQGGRSAAKRRQLMKTQDATQAATSSAAPSRTRAQNRRSSSSAAIAKTKPSSGYSSSSSSSSGGSGATAPKPAATATKPTATATKSTPAPAAPAKDRMATASKSDRMAAWAKANPTLAKKPTTKPSPTPSSPTTKPAPTASTKPMSRIAKATSGIKPMREDFDIILEHLIESGFGFDEAIQMMVEMSAEKRQQILEGSCGETEDSLKDKRMERGGVDGNNRYDKKSNVPTLADKKGKKTEYDGMSAMEKVKASIRSKYGDGAIKDTKKKKED